MKQRGTNEILLGLIRGFLNEEAPTQDHCYQQQEVLALAVRHDVAHLIAVGLERLGDCDGLISAEKRKAIYRYLKQDNERQQIYQHFEEEKIQFIPLKGGVINTFYPEPWQRTGCDIDILVRKDVVNFAVALLEQQLGYTKDKSSSHDISLMSPSGVHLELHYAFDEIEVPLDEVWCSATPIGEGSMQHAMRGELFMLHHMAHMAKHFRSGGCGLRPFVDLWFLRGNMVYDLDKLDVYLESCGLKKFADLVFEVLDVWFSDGERTPLIDALENYVLPAGAYGSVKNHVAVGQINKGSKASYFLSRLFQSKAALEYPYPCLKEHGWLLPFCQVHRWCKLLADGKGKRILIELKANSDMDTEYREGVGALMEELGLL